MGTISLEDFTDSYIEAVLEAIQMRLTGFNVFYKHVHERVSERTGLSQEEIIHLHHPFHWVLFRNGSSPLVLISANRNEGEPYEIKIRREDLPIEKSKLVADVLKQYRPLLQKRLDKMQG